MAFVRNEYLPLKTLHRSHRYLDPVWVGNIVDFLHPLCLSSIIGRESWSTPTFGGVSLFLLSRDPGTILNSGQKFWLQRTRQLRWTGKGKGRHREKVRQRDKSAIPSLLWSHMPLRLRARSIWALNHRLIPTLSRVKQSRFSETLNGPRQCDAPVRRIA